MPSLFSNNKSFTRAHGGEAKNMLISSQKTLVMQLISGQ